MKSDQLQHELETTRESLTDATALMNRYAAERDRLRLALDKAFSIMKLALPCPRPWDTESDEAKLRIFENIARDRRAHELEKTL